MKPNSESTASHTAPIPTKAFTSDEWFASGRSFANLLIAFLAGGVLAVGALAAAVWRGVTALDQYEVERQQELQTFHAGLLDELRELAEQSGMLNSADLCLVRFRVHYDGSVYEPVVDPSRQSRRRGTGRSDSWVSDRLEAKLWSIDDPVHLIGHDPFENGQLKYGLLPPGAYRLELTFDDEYQLRHEFKVRAGIPVDRLLRCPRPAGRDSTGGRIEVAWPEALADYTLVAVCEVERDVATCGEWEWDPIRPERVTVMAGGERMLDALGTARLDISDVLPSVPFRYCRMTEINVFHVPEDGRTPVAVGSCLFGDDAPTEGSDLEPSSWNTVPILDSSEPVDSQRTIRTRNAPRHEVINKQWRIELPAELIDAVSQNLPQQACDQ